MMLPDPNLAKSLLNMTNALRAAEKLKQSESGDKAITVLLSIPTNLLPASPLNDILKRIKTNGSDSDPC